MNTTLQSQLAPFAEKCRQRLSTADSNTTKTAPEITDHEKQVLAEASKALKAWEASPDGQAKLQAMKGMSLAEIREELLALLQSPVFTSTLALISKPSLPILKYPIQTISLALKVEVDFVLFGFSGSIGAAVDPAQLIQFIKNPRDGGLSAVTFISGWVNEGLDEGAMTGIEVGVSGSAPNDIGGYSSGYELTIDILADIFENPELPGITGQVYKGSSDGSWGATIGLVWGADVGGVATESYTIILTDTDLSIPPIYQPPADHFMIINSIVCQNSNMNTDHVYFKFTVDNGTTYRYPTWDHRNMSEDKGSTYNNTWNAGRSVRFNSQVEVTLYSESDSGIGDDDQLGDTKTFYASTFVSPQYPESKHGINETTYQINATLIY